MIAATTCPSDVPNCAGLLDVNLTLVVELAIFLITVFILWRLVWRPIIELLERRDQRIAAGANAAAEAERRYNEGLTEVQRTLDQSRAEARDILGAAQRTANAAAEQLRAASAAEARRISDAALEEIRRESDAAVAALRPQAQRLAVAAAERLLGTDLDEERFAAVAARAVRS